MKQLILFLLFSCGTLAAAEKPNILWFVVDDMSANFSCYGGDGDPDAARGPPSREGTKFTNAFVTGTGVLGLPVSANHGDVPDKYRRASSSKRPRYFENSSAAGVEPVRRCCKKQATTLASAAACPK
jgi:hypothetical protein